MNAILKTDVCIIGGGPGGAMLAMLLARQGINTTLVERAATPNREFRGESISPDSVHILEQIGIMPYVKSHGYIETKKMQVFDDNQRLLEVDFNRFTFAKKFSIDVPQPVLISALITEAKKHANFIYLNSTHCEDLISKDGMITGAICRHEDRQVKIMSRIIVGADGRYGKIRKIAKLSAKITPLKRDVLWFMLPKPDNWGEVARLCMNKDKHIIILPTYPNSLRVGLNIVSGGYSKIRKNDISYLHQLVAELEPSLAHTIKEHVKDWSDTSLLDIFTMEVPKKSLNGLILIGDAAHTLTPILGQGVNQAIKDAYFVAPILVKALNSQPAIISGKTFKSFYKMREKEVRCIHQFQIRQERIISLSSALAIFLRKTLYRFMNSSFWLQKKLWGKLLYNYQIKYKIGQIV